MQRRLELTHERLVAYSRSGNFHSDPDAAEQLGYRGMVAQGMQAAGPAYGLALETWGEEFLASGTFEAKFVGMVFEGDAVVAEVTPAHSTEDEAPDLGRATTAEFTVTESERTVVVGRVSRP